ncbi:MAG: hypothetical protein M1816_008212 [Peltula sp. TS41687]|nr:MAG: hypothetical protein M1816_008212 [Peltula sp. TS41687]
MCVGTNYHNVRCGHYEVAYSPSHQRCRPRPCKPVLGRTFRLDAVCGACDRREREINAEWDAAMTRCHERLEEAERLGRPTDGIRDEMARIDAERAEKLTALRARTH